MRNSVLKKDARIKAAQLYKPDSPPLLTSIRWQDSSKKQEPRPLGLKVSRIDGVDGCRRIADQQERLLECSLVEWEEEGSYRVEAAPLSSLFEPPGQDCQAGWRLPLLHPPRHSPPPVLHLVPA
jgi:hypothetical protein